MEQSFPTGNKDVDRLLLLRLKDSELLNTLSLGTTNRLINKYLNDEEFWRLRFEKRYPLDFEKAKQLKQRSWKDFSLLLIKYLDLSEEARGVNKWNVGLYYAAKESHIDLVDYFIFKGANRLEEGMRDAAKEGNKNLVDFFITKGAKDWNMGMQSAARGGHRDLVDFFIKKGANEWNNAMFDARIGGHRDLVDFFQSKMRKMIIL